MKTNVYSYEGEHLGLISYVRCATEQKIVAQFLVKWNVEPGRKVLNWNKNFNEFILNIVLKWLLCIREWPRHNLNINQNQVKEALPLSTPIYISPSKAEVISLPSETYGNIWRPFGYLNLEGPQLSLCKYSPEILLTPYSAWQHLYNKNKTPPECALAKVVAVSTVCLNKLHFPTADLNMILQSY